MLLTRAQSSSSHNSHSPSPTRKRSIFARDSSSRHRSNSSNSDPGENKSRFFGLGRNNNISNDPSIRRARKKVADAQEAEKRADQALTDARKRVREAQGHVQSLEQEASQGSKLAKAKAAESKIVSKSAKALGRHGA